MSVDAVITTVVTVLLGLPAFITLYKSEYSKIFFFHIKDSTLLEKALDAKNRAMHNQKKLVMGVIVYVGKNDLIPDKTQKGLSFSINGSKSKVHSIFIPFRKEELELQLNKEKRVINFPLLRDGDYLFCAVLADEKIKAISVRHRLANVQPVVQRRKGNLLSAKVLVGACTVLIASILYFYNTSPEFNLTNDKIAPTYFNYLNSPMSENFSLEPDTSYEEKENGEITMFIVTRDVDLSMYDTTRRAFIRQMSAAELATMGASQTFPLTGEFSGCSVHYKLKNRERVSLLLLGLGSILVLCSLILTSSLAFILRLKKAAEAYADAIKEFALAEVPSAEPSQTAQKNISSSYNYTISRKS